MSIARPTKFGQLNCYASTPRLLPSVCRVCASRANESTFSLSHKQFMYVDSLHQQMGLSLLQF